MIRSYENKVEKIIKSLLTELIYSDLNKKFINSICIAYTMLLRLSTNPNQKLKVLITLLSDNIKAYKIAFKPKTMNSMNQTTKKDNDLLLGEIKQLNIQVCKNVIYVLLKLIKSAIRVIPKSYEIDMSILLSLIVNHDVELKTKEYVVEGLAYEDYKIFSEFINYYTLKFLSFVIKEFSEYIYIQVGTLKKVVSKMILKEPDYLESYMQTLKVFTLIISKFDARLKSLVFDIVFKYSFNNFIDVFITYLERNDKTIIKVDQKFFKLGNIKNKKNKKSLLQIAMNDTYNQKLERLADNDIRKILLLYLDSK
jgi:hypothetical protein